MRSAPFGSSTAQFMPLTGAFAPGSTALVWTHIFAGAVFGTIMCL